MASTTKLQNLSPIHPPLDIRENTKARRAWLEAEALRMEALGYVTKVCGTGSYQYVSVKKAVTVEGRLRHRGVCQCCGNLQVVVDGVLVLHGYKRPGWGYAVGRCPGTEKAPLNVETTWTIKWRKAAILLKAQFTRKVQLAEVRLNKATAAWVAASEDGAWQYRPREPRYSTDEDAQVAYCAALKVWTSTYPCTAEREAANAHHADMRQNRWYAAQEVEHFARLLSSGIHGTPLKEEVVTG